MIKKNYVLSIEMADNTRMSCDREVEIESLEGLLRAFYKVWTSGPEPAVKISEITTTALRAAADAMEAL